MIVGTAGHIDHGKTALVQALTGVDTDRLPEEKRRGITLELGFAELTLPDGRRASVVDVPGHERFVKAMAAGAGGVDVALFVVAADEGVMPQTREHLDICALLGVRRGVVALTKSDLLEGLGPDWRAMVEADVRALTAGTFLEGAPIVACSARTGEGLPALVDALGAATRELAPRPAEGPVFLPIDRAFSLKGFGTIATGTLLSGTLRAGDELERLPEPGAPLRIRGLQVHGAPVTEARAGTRVAVNLAAVEAGALARGEVLAHPRTVPPSRMLDVAVRLLPGLDRPLGPRSKLFLHLGTAQVEATLALLDRRELMPGETAPAQLRLGHPVAALVGQRFILRGTRALEGRGATVAGGEVLTIAAPKRRGQPRLPTREHPETGAANEAVPGSSARRHPDTRVTNRGQAPRAPTNTGDSRVAPGDWPLKIISLLRDAGWEGRSERELHARSALAAKPLRALLEQLGARGQGVLVDREARTYVAADVVTGLERRTLALLAQAHLAAPLEDGLSREEVRQRLSPGLDPKLFHRVLQGLVASEAVEVDGERMRPKGQRRALTPSDERARNSLVDTLRQAQLAPPSVKELAATHRLPPAQVAALLDAAAAEGGVVRVVDGLYFHAEALLALKTALVERLQASKEISTQGFKELVGQSRKFAIPLSEYFDRERVTLRVGEKRVLRRA